MADWTRGMGRTYEYWEVDPSTWGDVAPVEGVTGCTIVRDDDTETLGHATLEMDGWEGERYIRSYLVTEQWGVRERWPLGTFLAQAPSVDFDGVRASSSVEGHTPLKELADDRPPVGFSVSSGDAVAAAAQLMAAHARMPVGSPCAGTPLSGPYVAEDGDTWLSYCKGLLAKGGGRAGLDAMGRAYFSPVRNPMSLMPTRVFDDSNSSIILPGVRISSNLPDAPNAVEVVWSDGERCLVGKASDADPDSEASTASRGRRVLFRELSPELPDSPTQADADALAGRILREKGAVTYEVTYTHGYVPDVMPGVAVRLRYAAAGIDVVAVVASQTIEATPGCLVTETARYTI